MCICALPRNWLYLEECPPRAFAVEPCVCVHGRPVEYLAFYRIIIGQQHTPSPFTVHRSRVIIILVLGGGDANQVTSIHYTRRVRQCRRYQCSGGQYPHC